MLSVSNVSMRYGAKILFEEVSTAFTPAKRYGLTGPNGSGKSTLLKYLHAKYSLPLGHDLNPDDLERELVQSRRIDFGKWKVVIHESELRTFFRAHPLASQLAKTKLSVQDNVLSVGDDFRSGYFVAVLCDLLRRKWVATGQTFTFETVMSSADKLDLLREANRAGYRTYLYFVCTNDPMINRGRIRNRVSEGGHDVPADKIAARYERSLGLLPGAIALCSRCYLFDNSEQTHRFIAEFEERKLVRTTEPLPPWFVRSWLNRNASPGGGEDAGQS